MGRGTPPDVGRRRKWFRLRRQLKAVGGTYDEIVYDPLLDREFLQIARIGVLNKDSGCSQIRLYVAGHGYEHWVGEENSTDTDTLYWVRWPTYLVGREQLVARFSGCNADDELSLYVEGWIWDYPVRPPEGALGIPDAVVE